MDTATVAVKGRNKEWDQNQKAEQADYYYRDADPGSATHNLLGLAGYWYYRRGPIPGALTLRQPAGETRGIGSRRKAAENDPRPRSDRIKGGSWNNGQVLHSGEEPKNPRYP